MHQVIYHLHEVGTRSAPYGALFEPPCAPARFFRYVRIKYVRNRPERQELEHEVKLKVRRQCPAAIDTKFQSLTSGRVYATEEL